MFKVGTTFNFIQDHYCPDEESILAPNPLTYIKK